jgi:O-antigen chain-terminating methyltransferase
MALQKTLNLTGQLAVQEERLTRLLASIETAPATSLDARQLESFMSEREHLLDAFYASFDEHFRGTREEIKERLRAYLPFVEKAAARDALIVDVGCGRGEWLELLREHGLNAQGVDLNGVLVDQCRADGLDVVQEDLIEFLGRLPDSSVSVVTGFHVVEHLTIEDLLSLLNQIMRVLSPGGLVILETPNPRNVLVGTCNFYFDPTHRNPLPSEVLKFLVKSKGFEKDELLLLNPSDEMPVEGDSELVTRFNQYFYGPMDYGIIAWKPSDIDN